MTNIDELRRLLAMATPGPWHRSTECEAKCCWHLFPSPLYGGAESHGEDGGEAITMPELSDEDSSLIVAAVNALPGLLDELERLRKIERRLAEAPVRTVGECCDHMYVERCVANAEEDIDVRQMVGQRIALVRMG